MPADLQQQLEQEQHMLERFFALSLDLLMVADTEGRILRSSPGFAVLGYSAEELRAIPFAELLLAEDLGIAGERLRAHERGESTVQFELRMRCKDGSLRWVAWNAVHEPGGLIYAIGRDVTLARERADELRHAHQDTEAARRELETFAYSVAHDLRSPLRAIDGFSLALAEEHADRLGDEGRRLTGLLRTSAQRMAHLIDSLLALSRATRSELRRQHVDVSELATQSVARLRRAEPGRHVEVQIQSGMTAHADAVLLGVALDNLVDNAWKFTRRRDQARIEVGRTLVDGRPAFFVRDNGAGFDMVYVGKLFGPFQRLHTVHEFEGTGVGLATVQRIVERHGGHIRAEGAVDGGATFAFTLEESAGP
jgi:PAS domain S-box-containing protein